MKNITVAIPFYNSIDYLEDAIRIPLLDDRVDEILICDDRSSDDQYYALLEFISRLLNGYKISYDPNFRLMSDYNQEDYVDQTLRHTTEVPEGIHGPAASIYILTCKDVSEQSKKIKVIRNKKNLGGFRNKYEAVKSSKNEWVYLLDSDNFLVDGSISALYNTPEWDDKTCYCPSVPIMERKRGYRAWDDWNHRRFGYEPFDLGGVQEFFKLEEKLSKQVGCGLGVNGLLNTGNFFVNRDNYTSSLKSAIENPVVEPHAADVIAFSYYWLTDNGKFQILPSLYYFHRIRDDSFWNTTGHVAGVASQMYEEMIKNANA
jgi:glycosyltransferase involved in cell wall biosynthesis